MIIVTGGEGFIGKNMIDGLLESGYYDDVVSLDVKSKSISEIKNWLVDNKHNIKYIIHLGAISDTTEKSIIKLNKYNYSFSIFIWNFCATYNIPLIYASSAATYGNGEVGFDDEININELKPLNLYADYKHYFDRFALVARQSPPQWFGLKFFNVYGYGEEDKGYMSSVIYHFYNQIKSTNKVKLYKSYKSHIPHGEQKRDFVYVNDIVNNCILLMNSNVKSGIYNMGTGNAVSYNDIAKTIFDILKIDTNIEYIEMPDSIKDKYQYLTQAKMDKLLSQDFSLSNTPLRKCIEEYIQKLSK